MVVRRRDIIAVVLLAVLVLAVFWRAVLGGVFYFGDIFQLHYPLRSVYARELRRLSLPLWTTDVLAGYPLLAEGQLGALYPPNLILHTLLPVPIALDLFILGHFVWAALGAYAFGRRIRLYPRAALCAGLIYALGGFMVAHLNHVNIVACAAWLPWMFLLTDRLLANEVPPHAGRDAVWLSLVIGLEFLAGHAQIAVLSLLAVMAYGLYLAVVVRPPTKAAALFGLSVALGVALSGAQLLPSYELTRLSVRSEGLDPEFFTSFSLHPLYIINLLWPFVLGNPYPNASVELVAYVGWLPLLLALAAPLALRRGIQAAFRPAKRTRFFLGMAIIAVLLALGRWNPVYMALLRLPVFQWFRVPARYLYLFSFSAAMLAGVGLDVLLNRIRDLDYTLEDQRGWLVILATAVLALLAAWLVPNADALVGIWSWLPLLFGALALGWLLWTLLGRGSSYAARATGAVVLIAIDLIAFNSVYNLTYNQTMPLGEFSAPPRSLAYFRTQEGVYRIYTHEEIVPVLPVMRESYYPNLSLIHGLASANGSFPLLPTDYARFVDQMTPQMLDLLGVEYFLIPQVLPVDEASEFYDLQDPYALNPVGRVIAIPPITVATLEVESYVSHSVDWSDGYPVAEINLRGTEGELETIILQAGWHTAEWAYDRSDVIQDVRHRQAPVVRTWPARSGFPAENHTGHTYHARFQLASPLRVQSIEVRPLVPQAYLRIERLILVDEGGARSTLAQMVNMGDHTLSYRSEDVAVYRNHDVLPRAFVVHKAQAVQDDDQALQLLRQDDLNLRSEVLLATDQVLASLFANGEADKAELVTYDSQRVTVKVDAAADGYLVLTDAWYPGWRVRVDGQEAPLLRADVIFRAVQVSAGSHVVEFEYAPQSFRMGLLVSATALIVLLGLWLFLEKLQPRRSWHRIVVENSSSSGSNWEELGQQED
jgi:hypothetical protein